MKVMHAKSVIKNKEVILYMETSLEDYLYSYIFDFITHEVEDDYLRELREKSIKSNVIIDNTFFLVE